MRSWWNAVKKHRRSASSLSIRLRVRPCVEELEGRLVLSTVSVTSTNWSGYAAETNLNAPASNAVTDVKGSWKVPSVSGSGTAYSAVWVGIDGYDYNSNTVQQIGTEQDTYRGQPHYSVWYEMYPAYPVTISAFTIQPGDEISAEVAYGTTNAGTGYTLSISNVTTNHSFTTFQTLAGAQRSSAEWIVEAPSNGYRTLPLANFGSAPTRGVAFSGAQATINGTTGAIDDSHWQAAKITMGTRRTTAASPTALTNSGATSSFTVNDVAQTPHTPPPGSTRGGRFQNNILVAPPVIATATSIVQANVMLPSTAVNGPAPPVAMLAVVPVTPYSQTIFNHGMSGIGEPMTDDDQPVQDAVGQPMDRPVPAPPPPQAVPVPVPNAPAAPPALPQPGVVMEPAVEEVFRTGDFGTGTLLLCDAQMAPAMDGAAVTLGLVLFLGLCKDRQPAEPESLKRRQPRV